MPFCLSLNICHIRNFEGVFCQPVRLIRHVFASTVLLFNVSLTQCDCSAHFFILKTSGATQ